MPRLTGCWRRSPPSWEGQSYDPAGVEKQHFAACHSGQAGGAAPGGRHRGGTVPADSEREASADQVRENQEGKATTGDYRG